MSWIPKCKHHSDQLLTATIHPRKTDTKSGSSLLEEKNQAWLNWRQRKVILSLIYSLGENGKAEVLLATGSVSLTHQDVFLLAVRV